MGLDGRIEYANLLKLARKGCGKMLDIHVHRYMAVAKGARLGCFSTIEMACREVDEQVTAYQGAFWTMTPAAHGTSYVVDLVAGQTYERVAQDSRRESEPTLA